MTLHGMTWDHPRSHQPLSAFAATHPAAGSVRWSVQTLADFEARPLVELAADYDLLVIDHPGLGSAIADGALLPLDDIFTQDELQKWAAQSVGRTWQSYHLDGAQWALPIDAATQVMMCRTDFEPALPRSWREVPDFAREHRTALGLAGPHALLVLLAMCADNTAAPDVLLDPDVAHRAIRVLRDTWDACDQDGRHLDPIEVHEAVAGGASGLLPPHLRIRLVCRPGVRMPSCRLGCRTGFRDRATGQRPRWYRPRRLAASRSPGRCRTAMGARLSRGRRPDRTRTRARRPAREHRRVGLPDHRRVLGRLLLGHPEIARHGLDPASRPRGPAFQDWASAVVRRAVEGGASPSAAVTEINDGHGRLVQSASTHARAGVQS